MILGLYKCFDHWHQEGTLFIYSDPHFSDADLPNRPSDEEQIRMINSKCGRKDTLIILGDIGNIECVKRLRAKRKILICGNHDAGRTNYERQIFVDYFKKDHFQKEEALLEAQRLHPGCRVSIESWCQFEEDAVWTWKTTADNMLFDEVYEGPLMIAEKLILSHEPIDVPWAYNIHGHIHDSKHKNDKRHLNVCSDAIGYVPINMNQWMKQGYLSHVESIHRTTIDKATERKKKRGGRSFNSHGQKR